MLGKLMNDLQEMKYVCTTADIWSANRRSYMGITVHWISDGNVRQSRALALRRLKGTGSHTFDCVAGTICSIHEQFDLDVAKVVGTVTNNASNFKKAFESYMSCQDSDDEEDDEDGDENVTLLDVSEILLETIDDSTGSITQLPRHIRCVCHSLNLIATTDLILTHAKLAISNTAECRPIM